MTSSIVNVDSSSILENCNSAFTPISASFAVTCTISKPIAELSEMLTSLLRSVNTGALSLISLNVNVTTTSADLMGDPPSVTVTLNVSDDSGGTNIPLLANCSLSRTLAV